ncbi:methyltransferase domain-containing protein [Haloferax mediterranei ATCC 33500]|uniref:Methyltransferase domain-containing protein n=1 Tax=Haloferax mediterranei (strain ATCC 33500 / DSM 1411 / JCM 8866 / NBRC 14739 / NCIMB 2177 / R-4) TaxID=523841 RepID=I3R4X9_HALMT|nr:methyltransferase domain-containing protein [Haloferax mediterranei]AFK19289.1 hypothetical protein HFX_1583 [Haloferax mediterranei ATCC 33500]AHZ21353.1 hypothetical protein BM92_01200 [Haloferax mediterranei ATCC 33500]EMA04522.1 hypothetical protein C439_02567 [Haloferax mediterranei ATCC 33500]MDX5989392.1 methyltransferase domain-containing protein [Haloferax mediterranei ATCC 33500]QCQ75756.1 methyltransferase domain-containing protein [Haloferax mediterranei ATCC 33500]
MATLEGGPSIGANIEHSGGAGERFDSEIENFDRANLGCGDEYKEGWYNVDIRDSVDPDAVWDFNDYPWPFPDDAFDEVVLDNVLEHLDDHYAALQEIHRITRVGGTAKIAGPHWNSAGAWIDPTHTRPFDPRTFEHYLMSDMFDIVDLTVDKVRWAKPLPDSAALWLADSFGQGVSGFEVVVTPTSQSK